MPVIIDQILRAGEGRTLRKLQRIAKEVNSLEDDFRELSDAALRALTDEYKRRLGDGESLAELLPEAFATVREAAKRTLGQRHFDVQIMGGVAMHWGNIAEMATGEGKTLVSTMPIYLNALTGKGVHVVTVNDYLAKRDAEWMGRIYRFLGLEVGAVLAQMPPDERRKAYAADVTYGTNNEFGFDYLRDNMAWSKEELVQREHHYAIVDEVDSILIDEARTPLIISGPAEQSPRWYVEFARIAPRLERDTDYEVDEKKRTVGILEPGVEKVEDILGIENLYEPVNTPLVSFLNNALKAKELFKRDKDYVVSEGGDVHIVDEFTGRILHGRRYSEGLHQAIEAKENVQIQDENQTQATITLQNYFRLYDKLAGMTGTAMTEAGEFQNIYKLGVVAIPTNEPMIRADEPDVVYKTPDAKWQAVVEDLAGRYDKAQPVLVGTTSVENSEHLSKLLTRRRIPHEVLNAKHHEREAAIIAQAGRKHSVTVATNMAGRGTDIMLGGNPEFMADVELHQRGLSPTETPEEYEAAWPEARDKAQRAVAEEHDEVVSFGGLYVLGTERHESRRIDNQLRGRSGRQGDPGESRFYLSLGDDLMRLFNAARVEQIMGRLNIPEDVPIESKMVSNAVKSAQHQVEEQNFEIRKNVLKYDEVLNRQRQVIYAERRKVLEGADLGDQVRNMISDVVAAYVRGETNEGFPEEWNLDRLWRALRQLYPASIAVGDIEEASGGGRGGLTAEFVTEEVRQDAHAAYDRREEELGPEVLRELERRVVLSVLDRKWREHLYEMDYLQEGIGLRAMAQRDPLVEYQREGFDMFNAMLEGIKEDSVATLFHLEVELQPEQTQADRQQSQQPQHQQSQVAAGTAASASATATSAGSGSVPASASAEGGAGAEEGASGGKAPEASGADGRQVVAKGISAPARPQRLEYTAPTVDGAGAGGVEHRREGGETGGKASGTGTKVSRNAPCPCGSGKKYKRCHGDPRTRAS